MNTAIACEIMKVLTAEPVRPSKTVRLGNEALLKMNMVAAANYWGVERAIEQRNRRSGRKKPKQVEREAATLQR